MRGKRTRIFQITGIYRANIYGNPMCIFIDNGWRPGIQKGIWCECTDFKLAPDFHSHSPSLRPFLLAFKRPFISDLTAPLKKTLINYIDFDYNRLAAPKNDYTTPIKGEMGLKDNRILLWGVNAACLDTMAELPLKGDLANFFGEGGMP